MLANFFEEGVRITMPTTQNTNTRSEPCLYHYIIVLITVMIWGITFAATKYAIAEAEPVLILLLRFIISIPVLAAGCLAEGTLRLPSRREAVVLLLLGFQGIFFQQGIQAIAMETASAGNANWMLVASPAVVALLGWIFLGEKISKSGIGGLALAAVGVILVFARGTVKATAEAGSFGAVGDYLMLFSVLNWAAFLIISRHFLKADMPPAFAIFWEIIFSAIFAFAAAHIMGIDFSVICHFSANTWYAIIFLGIMSSAIAYLLWYKALSAMPAAKLTVFQFLQPVIGMVASYFLVGERYTMWIVLGAVMITAGIWLVNKK